jgi:hypothetical protein
MALAKVEEDEAEIRKLQAETSDGQVIIDGRPAGVPDDDGDDEDPDGDAS